MDMNLSRLHEIVEDRGAWVLEFLESERVGAEHSNRSPELRGDITPRTVT